jgi:hypothetical protein
MDAKTHAVTKRAPAHNRAAAARARRGAWSGRGAAVTLLRATDGAGIEYLLAMTPGEPSRAYVLTKDAAGRWACGCWSAKYGPRRSCAHQEAANAAKE